jgi:glycosyltransferase involved in cell wall biosynthesis
MPAAPLLSVVVPVYNERDTVLPLLEALAAVDLGRWTREVLVVDDGSTDGTADRLAASAEGLGIRLFRLPANRGKGAAVRRGLAEARGEAVLIQDADLEYDPADIPALLAKLDEGHPVVYGSRILHPENREHSALRFYLGGRLVTWVTNRLFGSRLTDEPTGYKLFRREALEGLDLVCEGFEFCPEVTAKLLRRRVPIVEVPIRYRPRKPEEGKKIGWWDGVEAVATLWRWRWKRFGP